MQSTPYFYRSMNVQREDPDIKISTTEAKSDRQTGYPAAENQNIHKNKNKE